jgi:drug/metabolite transporter (DMT)-like permease
MLFSATEAIFIKRVVQLSNADVSMITWCWFGAFFALPMVWFRCQNKECKNKRWRNIKRQIYFALPEYKKYLLLAASIGVMQLSTNYAFRNMNVGYALALFQLSAIVSLFFGWRYFDEHGIFRKLLGSVIMISGSVLIILFGG